MKKDKQNDDGGKHQFAATTMSEPLPGYEHKRVPYALVRPDPNQPRKEFPEAGLKELADSIREKGIVQDLILELVGERGHDPLQPYYRIVCGERRWRAAGIVGLAEVPAKVYQELAPAQRWAVQIIENHQRENLTALEEAAAFARQIEEERRSDPDFSAETLARETGMSRAAMYERLKLNRLLTPVRKALEKGAISTSVAGEIAKVPTEKAQCKLLAKVDEALKYGRTLSVRQVQDVIKAEYVKPLKEAPFDTTDENWMEGMDLKETAKLAEGTFAGSCQQCRHRTGNMIEEWPELKATPNVCTNPGCFGEKCKRHWTREAKDLAQAGKTVLTEKEFKAQQTKYIAGEKHECTQNKSGTFEELMGKKAPEPVLVSTAEGLKKFYPKEEAVAAARKNGVKFYKDPAASKESAAKEKSKREAGQKLHDEREALAEGLTAQAAKGMNALTDKDAWALLAKAMSKWVPPLLKKLNQHVKGDRARVLAYHLNDELGAVADYTTGEWVKEKLALWKALGVDIKAEWDKQKTTGPRTTDQMTEELPLKTEAKQKTFEAIVTKRNKGGQLTLETKAKIIAAQKARWAKVRAKKN